MSSGVGFRTAGCFEAMVILFKMSHSEATYLQKNVRVKKEPCGVRARRPSFAALLPGHGLVGRKKYTWSRGI